MLFSTSKSSEATHCANFITLFSFYVAVNEISISGIIRMACITIGVQLRELMEVYFVLKSEYNYEKIQFIFTRKFTLLIFGFLKN